MRVLLTNDDGYESAFLQSLLRYCKNNVANANVIVAAPKHNNSGISHAVNISGEIEFIKKKEDEFIVNGTPTDCVNVASDILGGFDIVLSGPNIGSNIGRDILYSGTVAAACEAAVREIPAVAFSIVDDFKCVHSYFNEKDFFSFLDTWMIALMKLAFEKKGKVINVNIVDFTSPLEEGSLVMRQYFEYQDVVNNTTCKEVYHAKQKLGIKKNNDNKDSDWALLCEGKNSYTVFSAWPEVEKDTMHTLHSYRGVAL